MQKPAQTKALPSKDLEVLESVQQRLIRTGEFDRLKQVLEQRLTECGWREDVKQQCRAQPTRSGLMENSSEDTQQGKASTSEGATRSGVNLVDTGARFAAEASSTVVLDAAAHSLLVAHTNRVLIYSLSPSSKPPQEVQIGEGPAVAAAGLSPDKRMLVVQRSPLHLQCLLLPSANMFLQGSQQRGSRILGFFWVPPPTSTTSAPPVATLIVVTQAGLELWTLAAESQVLTFREARKHPTQWFIYSHEMRLVLLGSGEPTSLWLQGCQFTADGMVRLPPFQIPAAVLQGGAEGSEGPEVPRPLLNPADLHLLNMGQQMFCAYVNRQRRILFLYHFYKDAVMLQHQLDLAGPDVQLSVVDGLLIIHYPGLALSAVFDPSISGRKPLAPPTPLTSPSEQAEGGSSEGDCEPLQQSLLFSGPNLVADRQCGVVWRCQVSMQHIVAACLDVLILVASLLQRRQSLHPDIDLRATILEASMRHLSAAVLPSGVRPLLDLLHGAYAKSRSMAPRPTAPHQDPQQEGSQISQPWTSPFAIIHPENIVKQLLMPWSLSQSVSEAHVAAVAGEAAASCTSAGLAPPPSLACLLITALIRSGCPSQAAWLVRTQPELASEQLALQLAQLEDRRGLEGGLQLGAAMLGRLNRPEQQARLLLRARLPLRALSVIRQHRLTQLDPAPILQSVALAGDAAVLAAAMTTCQGLFPQLPSSLSSIQTCTSARQQRAWS
ncbi:hypothetical protein WJX74_009708 [Apatococcus lobatus]|uniref:Uncharacterized protein n=1 Tax=Apatococcus lobatus TaxID=904363 RepID=A0AAW1S810_9CHLO